MLRMRSPTFGGDVIDVSVAAADVGALANFGWWHCPASGEALSGRDLDEPEPRFPRVSDLMRTAKADVLAFTRSNG